MAVILAGRPLTFHEVAARAAAVLYAWHPGTMGGPAIAEALFGETAPSGRLSVTFPRTLGQVPIYYDHMSTGRPPAETGPEASDKYRSKYLDVGFTPEYPFGYGLSYTRFAYSGLKLSATRIQMGGRITVAAKIANAGARGADEIVQLYTRQLAASVTRPVRELRAFRRVHLKPGEKKTVEFALTSDELAFYNARGQLAAEPGKFDVWIAPDSASGLMGTFDLAQ